MRSVLALAVFPGMALAEAPLTAEEFGARIEGRTLVFTQHGTVWGQERCFPGARVLWQGADGRCLEGSWRETEEGFICFSDRLGPTEPQCGRFIPEGAGMRLEMQGASAGTGGAGTGGEGTGIARAEETDRPMLCQGPEAGA